MLCPFVLSGLMLVDFVKGVLGHQLGAMCEAERIARCLLGIEPMANQLAGAKQHQAVD